MKIGIIGMNSISTDFLEEILKEDDLTISGIHLLNQDEMKKFLVEENSFEQNKNNHNLRQLIEFNVNRIQRLFDEGHKLIPLLKCRLKYEIGWTVAGGEEILAKVIKNNYNVFASRPKLGKMRLVSLFLKSAIKYI